LDSNLLRKQGMSLATTYFRYSSLVSFIIFLGVSPFSLIASFFVPGIWRKGIGLPLILFVVLLNLVFTTALVFSNKVSINSQGIKCSDFWGKAYFVEWSTITGARYHSGFWTLGLKFILISTSQLSKQLWLPLFLNNMPQFQRLVSDYTSKTNPLRIRVNQQTTPDYLLKEAENQIKLAWQAGIVTGSATLVLVALSLAGYNIISGIDALTILDACLAFGLSFGIYKKSRIAAVIMVVYFITNQAWAVIELQRFPGIVSWVFLILYIRGVQGTFTYQKLSKR
jgi:hypothetical protein